jgi:hypothetical protein
MNGNDQEALESWIRWRAWGFSTAEVEPALRRAFEEGGFERTTEVVLRVLDSRFQTRCLVAPWYGARMLAVVGDNERMFECLEQSIEQQRAERLAKVHPIYDPYRDDPRFQAFLRRSRLAE